MNEEVEKERYAWKDKDPNGAVPRNENGSVSLLRLNEEMNSIKLLILVPGFISWISLLNVQKVLMLHPKLWNKNV